MSSMDSRFGNPDDWGLSPARHGEIASELGDHLDCLQADEGSDRAQEAEAKLATPRVRRKLTIAHITDQVVATLHRRPNRSEWRELGWLVFWFAVVLLGDWLAGYCTDHVRYRYNLYSDTEMPGIYQNMAIASWLLLGVGRAMFFLVLGKGIYEAWRLGWGVLIGRLLQYKLIHTLMVIAGVVLLNSHLGDSGGMGMLGRTKLPVPAISAIVGILLLMALATSLAVPQFRRKPVWLVCLLLLLFTYPTGPARVRIANYSRPFPSMQVSEDEQHRYHGAQTDPQKIQERMASYVRSIGRLPHGWSMEHRFIDWRDIQYGGPPLNAIVAMLTDTHGSSSRVVKDVVWLDEKAEYGPWFATTPGNYPAAGLGWIAAPVPLMGILGLLSMLFIMGRRGPVPAMLYALLTVIALYCSVIPFVMSQKLSTIIDFSLQAFSKGPLPGFEQILGFYEVQSGIMIMGALLLSAGIPWLLTGLFLRGEHGSPLPVDDDADLATG